MKLNLGYTLNVLFEILGGFLRAKSINDVITVIAHEICVHPYVIRNVKSLSHEFWIGL